MGASTSTLVLQSSSNLTQAESNVLVAATNYEKSKVQLDLSTADTLTKLGIDLNDAESGKVQHPPRIPGVIPATGNDFTVPKVTPLQVPGVTNPTQPEMQPQPQQPSQPH